MRFRVCISILFLVGCVTLASADTVQVRFLDENGTPLEGVAATQMNATGYPIAKLAPLPGQSVFDVTAAAGDKLLFELEHPAQTLIKVDTTVPADHAGILDIAIPPAADPAQAPANDTCDGAVPLAVPSITAGSTIGAGIDPSAPFCGTASITSPGVWYSFIGTGNTVTASTCNDADYDTKISILCKGCDTLQCVGGFDDYAGCAGFTTQVTVPTQAGFEYLVLVHGFGGASGNFNLTMSEGAPADFDLVDCAPSGACCDCAAPPFNCNILTADACALRGGQYAGDDTACIEPAGMPTAYGSAPGAPISSSLPAVEDVINVPDMFAVGDVTVELNIDHTWIGDLDIVIDHGGVSQTIWDRRCGSTDNIYATVSDAGTETLCAVINAGPSNAVFYSSAVAGLGPLSVFDGLPAAGDWTLTVDDLVGGDDGTLNFWNLNLDNAILNCPDQNGPTCFLCAAGDEDSDDSDDDSDDMDYDDSAQIRALGRR